MHGFKNAGLGSDVHAHAAYALILLMLGAKSSRFAAKTMLNVAL